jgi:hypothetical protein
MKGENMKYLIFFFLLVAIITIAGCVVSESNQLSYCGGIQYDNQKQWCCGKTLYTWQEKVDQHIGCCDETIYDYNDYQCCNNRTSKNVIYNWHNQGCCLEGGVYDRKTQECCYDTVYDKTTQGCCRFDVYDLATQGCCVKNDYIKVTYNTTNQHCCNKIVESGGGKWDTCGGQCYNLDTHSCCSDENSINKINEGALSCCRGRPSSINGTSCDPATGLYPSKGQGPSHHYIPIGGNVIIVEYF